MGLFKSAFVAGTVLIAVPCSAQGITVVGYIPGAKCMLLNLTHEQLMDNSIDIPIRTEPRLDAPELALSTVTVIVRDIPGNTNGFVEVMLANGRTGWIESRWLKPWSNPNSPTARCRPVVLSNGRLGFERK